MYSQDSFLRVLRRRKKQFSLDSCPYISDSSIRNYSMNNILSISGPSRSGKSLLISHIISDLLTTEGLLGKIVLIVTDNTFDFEILTNKIENIVNIEEKKTAESYLSNFLYLPVKNLYEFNLVLRSLHYSLNFGELKIHSLVIDSILALHNWIDNFTPNQLGFRKSDLHFKKIIRLCKIHAIFLIYTDSLNSEQKNKIFYAKIIDDYDNCLKLTDKKEISTPESKTPTETRDDFDLSDQNVYNDLIISLGATDSDDYNLGYSSSPKSLDYNLPSDYDRYNDLEIVEGNIKEDLAIFDIDDRGLAIKCIIPESWIGESDEEHMKDMVSLVMTTSRNLGKNYISIISKDYRNESTFNDKDEENKIKQVTRITSFIFREVIQSVKFTPHLSIQNGGYKSNPNPNGSNKGISDCPDTSQSKVESDENVEILHKLEIVPYNINEKNLKEKPIRDFGVDLGTKIINDHNLKVYRIDSRIKLTECSYKLLNV